jgi:hypothetical protein
MPYLPGPATHKTQTITTRQPKDNQKTNNNHNKTNKRQTKDKQKTNKRQTKDKQKTNKRRQTTKCQCPTDHVDIHSCQQVSISFDTWHVLTSFVEKGTRPINLHLFSKRGT